MRNFVLSTLILLASSLAFATDCSQLPHQGPVVANIVLADGTVAVFKANLQIEHIKEGIGQNTTSHTYNSPRVFVGNTEVAVSEAGLDLIAKRLGYYGIGFRDVEVNGGYFRKRITLVTDGDKLVLVKSPQFAQVVASKGAVKFFHPECADWQF